VRWPFIINLAKYKTRVQQAAAAATKKNQFPTASTISEKVTPVELPPLLPLGLLGGTTVDGKEKN
jgi:hypothetical protein